LLRGPEKSRLRHRRNRATGKVLGVVVEGCAARAVSLWPTWPTGPGRFAWLGKSGICPHHRSSERASCHGSNAKTLPGASPRW